MTALTSLADGWAALAWAVTWQLAALALLAWLAERLFKLREPRVRHALWWFVLVAPLVLAPGRLALTQRQAAVEIAVPTPAPVARVARAVPSFPYHVMRAEADARPSRVRVRNAEVAFDAVHRPGLALAWLLGCAALTLRLIRGHRRVRRMLAASRPVEDAAALQALRALCAEAGLRTGVELRSSDLIGAPVLHGIRRPVILVPEWMDSLAGDELRALLAHEVAHVRRRDVLANLAQRVIEIPLFFHPGAWLASRRVTLAREELCDAWALGQGADPASYARSLAAAAERAHASAAAASLGVVESRFTLLKRVQAILEVRSMKHVTRPLAIALAALLAISAAAFACVRVTGAREKGAAPASVTTAPSAEARNLRETLANLETKRAELVKEYPPTSEAVRAVDAQIEDAKTRLAALSRREADTIIGKQNEAPRVRMNVARRNLVASLASAPPSGTGSAAPGVGQGAVVPRPSETSPSQRALYPSLLQLRFTPLRFAYEAPFRHKLSVIIEHYEGGRLKQQVMNARFARLPAGKTNLVIFGREANEELTFSVTRATPDWSGSSSMTTTDTAVSISGYARSGAAGPEGSDTLIPGKKVPLWVLWADHKSRGSTTNTLTPAAMISAHDLVLVVYARIEAAPAAAEPTVFDTINLKYADPAEIAWLFGKGDLPRVGLLEEGGGAAAAEGGEAAHAWRRGALAHLLPNGIDSLAPAGYKSKQLVVSGTKEAISELRRLIALLDVKLPRVAVEVTYVVGPPAGARESPAVKAGGQISGEGKVADDPLHTMKLPSGAVPFHTEVEAQDNYPALVVLPEQGGLPQYFLAVCPRVNGDGTITVSLRLSRTDKPPALFEERGRAAWVASTALGMVRVKDAETLGKVFDLAGAKATVLVTPRIIAEDAPATSAGRG